MDSHWLFSWPLSWPVSAVLQAAIAICAATSWIDYGRTQKRSRAFVGVITLAAMWFNGLVGSLLST